MLGVSRAAVSRVIVVDPESEGQRVDVFLASLLAEMSRSRLRRLIDEQRVMVDGVSVKASQRLRAGQRVALRIPPAEPVEVIAQDIPLSVLYEDDDLVVLDKPPGIVVHSAPANPDGTLVNALLHHCKDLSGVGGKLRPGIVHRLDRGTSGVMVVTKNDRSHRHLSSQFKAHRTHKTYLAFAGRRAGAAPLPDAARFETRFGRHPVHRKRFSSQVEVGKEARTDYRVLRRFGGAGWEALKIEARPITGRTHQIRVHLADAGHPILGDKLYGGRSARGFPPDLLPSRQALHAWELAFEHPRTGEIVRFRAPLPDDLTLLERRLEADGT